MLGPDPLQIFNEFPSKATIRIRGVYACNSKGQRTHATCLQELLVREFRISKVLLGAGIKISSFKGIKANI